MSDKIKIVCVVGPTASGKTELAVGLAQQLNGEVVSADSMQIYKGMHIASAAPDAQEMMGIPHHMLEFLEYGSVFSVADYVAKAREIISDISNKGKVPIIAGGTGLYINSLVDNIDFIDQKPDLELRARLIGQFDLLGGEEMLSRLEKIDSAAAEKLHKNDKRRIIRAFEIYESTGLTPSENNILSRKGGRLYDPVMIGVTYDDRQKLYDRINLRVDLMLDNGLLQEAQVAFRKSQGNLSSGAVQAIGHKEFFNYFEGESSLEDCVEALKRSTRRYAKRQLTWFNKDERINWIYKDFEDDVLDRAMEIIKAEGDLCENIQL